MWKKVLVVHEDDVADGGGEPRDEHVLQVEEGEDEGRFVQTFRRLAREDVA